MLKGIEAIEGLSEEHIAAINALAGGLSDKNKELLDKMSASKTAATGAEAEMEALRMFKSNADIKIAEDAQNWKEAQELKDKLHADELLRVNGVSDSNKALVEKLLIDGGLSDALQGVKINPSLMAGATAMLKSQVTLIDGKAMVGEKSLSEHVTEWSTTDTGKAFCMAPDSSGVGATGGTNNGDASPDVNQAAEDAKKSGNLNDFLSASLGKP